MEVISFLLILKTYIFLNLGYEQNFNLPSSNNQLQVKNEDDSIRCLTLNKNSLSLFVATENG